MASQSDIAGALAAIEQRLADNWNQTPIAYENKDPDGAWPPVSDAPDLKPLPWVFCQLVDVESRIVGFGAPGNQVVRDDGFLKLFVMVPKGSGLADARQMATALGEIFRQKQFYTTDPTAWVRTKTPRVGRDPMVSEDGNAVAGACVTIPYEFTSRR